MRLPAVFETRDFLLCVVASSQRKQPWMKQVDSTFPQIRQPNQDPHNRTWVRKQNKRATLQPPQLLQGQMIVMRMSYPGAASATKMPLCAAMAVMGTSTASAVFGKAMRSLTWRTTTPPAIIFLANRSDHTLHGQKRSCRMGKQRSRPDGKNPSGFAAKTGDVLDS